MEYNNVTAITVHTYANLLAFCMVDVVPERTVHTLAVLAFSMADVFQGRMVFPVHICAVGAVEVFF